MIARNLCACVVALLWLLSATLAHASNIHDAYRQEDPRLETPVTMVAPRITVGELLERLARQTGIVLSADEQDTASGIEVAVFLTNIPLVEALNALWSLFSYQEAGWHWLRREQEGKYAYRLIEPALAKELASRILLEGQKAFESEADFLLRAARMRPEERKRLAKEYEKNKAIHYALNNHRAMAGLELFAETLTQEQMQRVLRGQEVIRVPVEALSPQGRAFVDRMVKDMPSYQRNEDGTLTPEPEPTWVQFKTRRGMGQLCPDMFIELQHHGALNYIGMGLKENFPDKVKAHWLLFGEQAVSPTEKRPFDPDDLPASQNANSPPTRANPPEKRLAFLAEQANLSLLARLPQWQQGRSIGTVHQQPPTKKQKTIGFYLDNHLLELSMRKWRGSVLLLSSFDWVFEYGQECPYALVKQVERAVKQGGGFPTLRDLAQLATQLRPEQFARLERRFPVGPGVRWHSLLQLCFRRPELASASGLALDEEVVVALRALPKEAARRALETEAVTRVRLREQRSREQADTLWVVKLELLAGERVVYREGYAARPPSLPRDERGLPIVPPIPTGQRILNPTDLTRRDMISTPAE